MQTVVGLYRRFEDAQQAVRALRDDGFRSEDVSLIASDREGNYARHLESGETEDVGSGAAAGAGVGAVLGGLGGLLVGLGALAIPGIGPVIAAGPIATTLAGAGIGAVAGGLVGALVDMGIPEEHANWYVEGVKQGGTLVVVRAQEDRADHAVSILNRFNPVDIDDRSAFTENESMYRESAVPVTGVSDTDTVRDTTYDTTYTGDMTHDKDMHDEHLHDERMSDRSDIPVTGSSDTFDIPVVEEEIRVGKEEVERGGVRIEKHTEEVPFEQDINLRQERINVDRRPADRPATDADFDAFKEGSIELTEKSEEPVVEKRARVVEEVHINKDVDETKETIHDTLHRQDVDVTDLHGSSSTKGTQRDWSTFDNDFRSHYNNKYGTGGYAYDYYQPAYRYGYTLAGDERYRDYDWNRLEMDARRDWERQGNQSLWEDIKDAVRYGWERARR